ncbi:MAG: di-trans,poly-cis-decaprenylcistransferase [Candidatus Zambryskibacteria bacterium CG11_big_fil_rev_8_21_14_0_20_42_18]|nr:MAG: di-trans,poly-cis-decaprenylcistransferase [Candidatus Zambryskibacteria bacterium CG11_big_fil_rev_8_21_14_0_20_42_18]
MDKKIPQCIGIILDGNRRWAKARSLSSFEGHKEGADRLRDAVYWVKARGVKHLVVYAFSTENWNRSEEEVSHMMNLAHALVEKMFSKISEDNICIKFVGERGRFDKRMQEDMRRVEEESKSNDAFTVWVCISYGGRAEIVEAARAVAVEGEITEESLAKNLWTNGMPDPDIIIRTGGEKRLSGFLPWQSVYSELFFIDNYWPDFSEAILDSVLREYAQRERRMGK